VEFLLEYAIRLFSRALREVKFDFYYIHEDMAGKGGPLMGPQLFREFLLPCYTQFIAFLKSQGVEIVLVDTDGDFTALIPIFLEAGVDGFGPIEIAADMDPQQLRRQYGAAFCMVGGVDKRAIAGGKTSIDNEINKITPLIRQGGFIPTIDHAVPPDVSYANFCYYLKEKRRVIWSEA
jgi:uroporphyrinogen decarboxylase